MPPGRINPKAALYGGMMTYGRQKAKESLTSWVRSEYGPGYVGGLGIGEVKRAADGRIMAYVVLAIDRERGASLESVAMWSTETALDPAVLDTATKLHRAPLNEAINATLSLRIRELVEEPAARKSLRTALAKKGVFPEGITQRDVCGACG